MASKNDWFQYSVLWHFEDATLAETYDSESQRDARFNVINSLLQSGVKYINNGDVIFNAEKVMCITKGCTDKYTYPQYNHTSTKWADKKGLDDGYIES